MFLIRQHVELNARSCVFALSSPFQYGDARAHEWRVEVTRNGNPVDLSGYTINLYARRADDSTAGPAAGTGGNGRASVVFPALVYNVVGDVTLILRAIKAASGSDPAETITLAILHARVARDTTDAIASEEVIVPNINELLAQIERMEQATAYASEQGDYAKEQGDYAKEQGDYAKEQGDYAKTQGDYAKAQGQAAEGAAGDASSAATAASAITQQVTDQIVPHFSVTVETLLPLEPATAEVDTTVDGTPLAPVLKLGIPRGQSGASNVETVSGVAPNLTGDVPIKVAGVGAVTNPNASDYGNIPLTPADLGAVPTSRTVNGKALSANVTLDAEDVHALPDDEPHLQSITRYHLLAAAEAAWVNEKYNNTTYSFKLTLACQGVTADDTAYASFDTSQATLYDFGTLQENFMNLWCVELAADQVIVHSARIRKIPILLEVIR